MSAWGETFLAENYFVKRNLFPQKIDAQESGDDHADMAKASRHPQKKHFLGPWLIRLKVKQNELAKKVGVTETHISNIVSHTKGAGLQLMLRISEALGVPVNDLFRMPPRTNEIETLRSFNPATIERLLNVPRSEDTHAKGE